jgi:hypothetical protein
MTRGAAITTSAWIKYPTSPGYWWLALPGRSNVYVALFSHRDEGTHWANQPNPDSWLTALDNDWFSQEYFQKKNPGALFRKARVPHSPYEAGDRDFEEMMANDSIGG